MNGDYLLQAMNEMIPTLKASPISAYRDVGQIFEVLLERVREKAHQAQVANEEAYLNAMRESL